MTLHTSSITNDQSVCICMVQSLQSFQLAVDLSASLVVFNLPSLNALV